MRCGRAISPSGRLLPSSRSSRCSVSAAAALSLAAKEASGVSVLAAVRDMGWIVLNSEPMTSAASPRKSAFRVIRWLVVALAILIFLPYLIAPLYRVINPVSTLMVGRWILGKRVERTWVPIGRVAPVLPRTVIASEDGRFCSHRGVDLAEMRAALEDAEDIADMRG